MKISKPFIAGLALIIINNTIGCSSDDALEVTPQTISTSVEETQNLTISNNQQQLSQRIQIVNRTATIDPIIKNLGTNVSAKNLGGSTTINGAQENYFWEHVAEVDALVLDGITLSATHISLAQNKAYVSYHKQGDIHKGAVEIIDLSNPNFPKITSQVNFDGADINAVASGIVNSNENVWCAISSAKHGAELYQLQAQNGQFINTLKRVNLSNLLPDVGISASANGISVTNSYIFVTAGKTRGGTFVLNKNDLSAIGAKSYRNAKYVVTNTSKAVSLITGDNASIKIADLNTSLESLTYGIGTIIHQNVVETYKGKSTMMFSPVNEDLLYIAKGKDGLGVVNVNTGNITNESEGLMLVVGNTNGVTADTDYIYMANGSDGIAIAKHPSEEGQEIVPVFNWDMNEDNASANFITADGEWVFVAKGGGGFKILRKRIKDEYKTITTYNSQGKPNGLEDDREICSTLLSNIFSNVLPERTNAMTAHPEYFENPNKDLEIVEETELYLTFLNEGAGYKNVLGYYTYNTNNPPNNITTLDKIVIFPNASAVRSGGELIPGNTMRLLGSFKPGTSVGFFLIANGWRNNKITDGIYSQHTDIHFNLSNRQQSILFYDKNCESTVIAFEDISVPNGDNDFNDAIFQIEASNSNAIKTNQFNQIGGN